MTTQILISAPSYFNGNLTFITKLPHCQLYVASALFTRSVAGQCRPSDQNRLHRSLTSCPAFSLRHFANISLHRLASHPPHISTGVHHSADTPLSQQQRGASFSRHTSLSAAQGCIIQQTHLSLSSTGVHHSADTPLSHQHRGASFSRHTSLSSAQGCIIQQTHLSLISTEVHHSADTPLSH